MPHPRAQEKQGDQYYLDRIDQLRGEIAELQGEAKVIEKLLEHQGAFVSQLAKPATPAEAQEEIQKLEKTLKANNKAIDNLMMQKLALEQKLVEINFNLQFSESHSTSNANSYNNTCEINPGQYLGKGPSEEPEKDQAALPPAHLAVRPREGARRVPKLNLKSQRVDGNLPAGQKKRLSIQVSSEKKKCHKKHGSWNNTSVHPANVNVRLNQSLSEE